MKTLENIDSDKAARVFGMTGFNFDIREEDNGDGTINLIFDSILDAEKFESIYNNL